jgi:hypothetical protein
MKRPLVIGLVSLAVAAAFFACDNTSMSGGRSNVRVLLTDAPIDLTGVSAVNVSLSGVVLFPADAGTGDDGGTELTSGPISLPGDLTVNLLDFRNGQTTFLGAAAVPAGSYSRIRLLIDSAELVRDDDNDPATPDLVQPIVVPSGKVDVPVTFQLAQGEDMTVTLDFDAQASVQVNATNGTNSYLLRPVVNVAHMASSGS